MTGNSLLKLSDVAKILNIGRTKSYELARRKKFTVVKIDGAIRVRYEDLQKFIDEQVEE